MALNSLLTHVAMHVKDVDVTRAFYEKYTELQLIHDRIDETTGQKTIWLTNASDAHDETSRFVIVLMGGDVPEHIVPGAAAGIGGLKPVSHLGFCMDSRDDVDRIGEMAKADGILNLGPLFMNDVIGYIAIVRDPDGNCLEFSHGQVLG